MITEINVNGFKSLDKFSLTFNQGLNVLIGPNGAGKSNICQSLAFIGAVSNDNLVDYILSLGGASNIFKVVDDGKDTNVAKKDITISCSGETICSLNEPDDVKLLFKYKINVAIFDALTINSEELKIYRIVENRKRVVISVKKTKSDKFTVIIDNPELVGHALDYLGAINESKKSKKTFNINIHPSDSILSYISRLAYFLHIVKEELAKLKVFNIDPHVAKLSSDILEPLSILGDGKRLANAIYDISRRDRIYLDELNTFMSNIMPRYSELNTEVTSDGLTRTFSITDIDGVKYPAQSLSDGTVKAIAFLVGMFEKHRETIILEEPENYLHPWACNSLINYLRDSYPDRSCILTTHSETILNAIKPSEIIVCANKGGTTFVERLNNTKELELAIQQSGFGCGYHYLSGALGGTPL